MHRRNRHRRSELRDRAIALRVDGTHAECALWGALRGGRLGVRFRRQAVLFGRYIADFYAPAARLVVEVDGGYHAVRELADARRDRVLTRAGYRVLRLSNDLVLADLDEAVRRVRAVLVAGGAEASLPRKSVAEVYRLERRARASRKSPRTA